MSDKKNIENLLSSLPEKELPKGYDERFHVRMEQEKNPAGWLKNILPMATFPTNLGMAAALGAVLLVALKLIKPNEEDQATDLAVGNEIDMLDDLDFFEQWDDKEDNV